jgi:hypothetical protein
VKTTPQSDARRFHGDGGNGGQSGSSDYVYAAGIMLDSSHYPGNLVFGRQVNHELPCTLPFSSGFLEDKERIDCHEIIADRQAPARGQAA